MPVKMKLTDVNLLQLLGASENVSLLREFTPRRYHRRTIIYSPFEETNQVFIVKSGRLRVYLAWEDKEFTLAFLESGDIFTTHTRAYVQAMDDTEILVCSTGAFQSHLASIPQVTLSMVKVLGDLLKSSISTIEGLAFKDVRRRLVDFLIEAAADRGRQTASGTVVELGLGTEDIALLVGTTRQTISQILNDCIKADLIEKVNRRTLLIKDLDALKELLDSL